MILIDYSAIAFGALTVLPRNLLTEETARHMILNSIRMYRKKFKGKYGEVVLCLDHGGNWRREFYPEYKYKRLADRAADDQEYWALAFGSINKVATELKENFPYKHVHIWGCEGDDIIATLCDMTQEFGKHEDVMIVSADKDFAQLQKWSNINQFSTITKKFIVEKDPHRFLFEHICKGDSGDSVPNIVSGDKVFVDGVRQSNTNKKRIDTWYESYKNTPDDLKLILGEEIARNFQRNEKMIDLSLIPPALKQEIINNYESSEVPAPSKVMPYLVKARTRELLENIGDFL